MLFRSLYGEVGPGQIVLVDVDGEGANATFTFEGQKVGTLPDMPPLETVAETIEPGDLGDFGDGDLPAAGND